MMVQVQMPPNTSAERTQAVLAEVSDFLLTDESEAVASVQTVTGFNFAGRSQGSGLAFVGLKPWEERKTSVFELAKRSMEDSFCQMSNDYILL